MRIKFLLVLMLFTFMVMQCSSATEKTAKPSSATGDQGAVNNAGTPSYQAIVSLIDDNIDATGSAIVVKEHRVVKLLTPAAVQRFSALEFTYVLPEQKVELTDVKVTSPDGKTTPISLLEVKEVSPLEKFPAFNNMKAIGLPLKDLQPGSVIDYSLTITDHPWIPGEYWEELFLQDMDPIVQEQITLTENEGREANVQVLHGSLDAPKVSHAGNAVVRQWELQNLAPYQVEFSMPPAADVAPRLVISTVKNWKQVADGFQSQYLVPLNEASLDKTLAEIIKKAKNQEDQIRQIYAFVTQSIRSLPAQFGGDVGKIPHPLDYSAIVNQGLGDSRDKGALLAALLKKAGFDVQLALISTVSNGAIISDFPLPFAFNRLVVLLSNKTNTVWLDPYSENCPLGYLPPEDQGRQAMLLSKAEFTETPIFPANENLREVSVKAKILGDGDLLESIELRARGADGLGIRSILRSMGDQERQQVVASIAAQVAREPKIDEVSLNSVDDLNSPISVGLKFQAKNYATVAGDLEFLSMPVNILNYYKSILTQVGPRRYPFILGNTLNEVKVMELSIPEGYKLRTVPKGAKVQNAIGSYEASFTSAKNKLTFKSTFIFDKASVSATDFEGLRALVTDKMKVEEGKIVLEKMKAHD